MTSTTQTAPPGSAPATQGTSREEIRARLDRLRDQATADHRRLGGTIRDAARRITPFLRGGSMVRLPNVFEAQKCVSSVDRSPDRPRGYVVELPEVCGPTDKRMFLDSDGKLYVATGLSTEGRCYAFQPWGETSNVPPHLVLQALDTVFSGMEAELRALEGQMLQHETVRTPPPSPGRLI